MAIQATKETKCHQPTLSCRIHADCPPAFMEAVTDLVSTGSGFPAIHSDRTGYEMLRNLGYEPEDSRKIGITAAVLYLIPERPLNGPPPAISALRRRWNLR